MKKLLALLLALMMLFSVATVFAGCEDSGKKKSSSSKNDDDDEDEDEDENEDKDDEDKDKDEDEDKDDEDKNKNEDENKDNQDKDDKDEDKDDEGKNKDDKDDKTDAGVSESTLKKALTKAIDTYYNAGSTDFYNCAPDDVYDFCEENYGYSMDEIEDTLPDYFDYMAKQFADLVGDNYSVSTKLLDYEQGDEDFLDKCAEELADYYGLKKSKVTDCYKLIAKLTLSGDDGSEDATNDSLLAICYDGEWYIADYYEWEDEEESEFGCEFMIEWLIDSVANMLEYPEDYE